MIPPFRGKSTVPIIIDCQTCGRKLRVPDDLLGQLVKCPTCGHTFACADGASAPVAETPASPERVLQPALSIPDAPPSVPGETLSSGGGFGYRQVSESSADPPAPGRRPPVPMPDDHDRPSSRRPGPTRCPFCDELLRGSPTRCPRCDEWLDRGPDPWDRRPSHDRRDVEPHRGGLILALGITGLVLGLTIFLIPIAWIPGLAAWIMGQKDLAKIHGGILESSGFGTTQAGWICGIIATCLWGLPTLGCVGWSFLRVVSY
jgi:hypothetical protein